MKRAGFTMIELIFVIVILGILAAVALPKFAGVSEQANAKKCQAFVGTLNRTVGPSMWAQQIDDSNGSSGNVVNLVTDDTVFEQYMAIADVPGFCVGIDDGSTPVYSDVVADALTAGVDIDGDGSDDYTFAMDTNGSISVSPRWSWTKL